MKKTLILGTALIVAMLMFSQITFAGTYTDDPAVAVTLTGSLNDSGEAELSWDQYQGGDLKWYKIVHSTTKTDAVYPDDGYVEVYTDPANTTYTHAGVEEGSNHYRVCVITDANLRGCSNTVTLEAEGGTTPPDPQDDPYTDDDSIDITLEGTLTDAGKADLSWTEYDGGDLKWYKVVRSQDEMEPYYPVDGYIAVYTKAEDTTHLDKSVPEGTSYYRVCVITTADMRGCSNTVTLTKEAGEDPKDDPKDEPKKDAAFPDTEDHWANDYIKDLKDDGIVEGRDGMYEPDQPVLRAEAIKMILVAMEVNEADCDASLFPDMADTDWFCGIVTKAFVLEVVQGEDGMLYPARNITRAEAVKILIVALGIDPAEVTENPFPDVDADEWYAKYAYKAKKKGLVSGTEEGLFEPGRDITRAEMAKIVSLAS